MIAAQPTAGLRLLAPAELSEKIAALSRPAIYGATGPVERIETHMSWLFFTTQHAYKLKKPVVSAALDFSTAQKRHWFCVQELLLNRRLAPQIYLDVVSLTRDANGQLHLNGPGEAIDYLVKMARLPAALALDRVIEQRALTRIHLRALTETLTHFYAHAGKFVVTAEAYRERFAVSIRSNRAALNAAHYDLPQQAIAAIVAAQLDYLDSPQCELRERAANNCIVDAHGDLRPEHIYLTNPVQVIDCLEFQRELRLLDPLHELGFLAMECARLGAPQAGKKILRLYGLYSGDTVSPSLIHFYQSCSALSRAKIAIWHLDDASVRDPARWHTRALEYLAIAQQKVATLGAARCMD